MRAEASAPSDTVFQPTAPAGAIKIEGFEDRFPGL
jgi:hypothetical protein